ncbi:hypothetical protein CRUP_008693, partial [Coryphaenoides rupestris]
EAQKKDKMLLNFPEKLKHIPAAARISVEMLDAELDSLTSRTRSVEQTVQTDSELLQQLDNFLQSAAVCLSVLRVSRQDLQSESSEVRGFFCEDRETFRLDDVFQIVHLFSSRFSTAVQENLERQAKEAAHRRRLREVEEQKRHSWSGGEEVGGVFRMRCRSETDVGQSGPSEAGLLLELLSPKLRPSRSPRRSRLPASGECELSALLGMATLHPEATPLPLASQPSGRPGNQTEHLSSHPCPPQTSVTMETPPPPPQTSVTMETPPPPPQTSVTMETPPPPPQTSITMETPPPPPQTSVTMETPPPPPPQTSVTMETPPPPPQTSITMETPPPPGIMGGSRERQEVVEEVEEGESRTSTNRKKKSRTSPTGSTNRKKESRTSPTGSTNRKESRTSPTGSTNRKKESSVGRTSPHMAGSRGRLLPSSTQAMRRVVPLAKPSREASSLGRGVEALPGQHQATGSKPAHRTQVESPSAAPPSLHRWDPGKSSPDPRGPKGPGVQGPAGRPVQPALRRAPSVRRPLEHGLFLLQMDTGHTHSSPSPLLHPPRLLTTYLL